MNGTLSPGLLVSVFASQERVEDEVGREDFYLRNRPAQGVRVSPLPKLRKPFIAVVVKVGRALVE